MAPSHLECKGKGEGLAVCSSFENHQWFSEEQEILKLHPRDTEITEKLYC